VADNVLPKDVHISQLRAKMAEQFNAPAAVMLSGYFQP
jgi:hypothetical protein